MSSSKTICIAAIFTFVMLGLSAQTMYWNWAKASGSYQEDVGRGIARDGNGNTYITGSYYCSISFGSINLSSVNSSGFVAKLSSAGTYLWAVSITSGSGYGIAVDAGANDWLYIYPRN